MAVFDFARGAGTQLLAASMQVKQSGAHLRTAGAHVTQLRVSPRRGAWTTDFYATPPDAELEAYRPGDVIRAEPMRAYLLPGIRFKARAYRVLYRSTGAIGEPTAVSGTLLLPQGRRSGPLPLVAYAPGTHGIGDNSAPSRLLSSGLDWEASPIAHVLARGFGIAVTDYQGLGTSGDHVFMVGRALGHNVLDSLRAAYQVFPQELPAEVPAGIIGYSEGGAAAAWAAQLHADYAPELSIAGVAAGAAAADMQRAVATLDGHFGSFFLTYGAIGYAAAYPELDLDPYLTEKGAKYVKIMRESNLFQAAVHGPRFVRAGELTEPNVLLLPDWQTRLAENRLGGIAPRVPVLLHHARHDQIVAPAQSEKLLSDWRALGADVSLRYMRGGVDHVTGGIVGAPVALGWLARVLLREPEKLPQSTAAVAVAASAA